MTDILFYTDDKVPMRMGDTYFYVDYSSYNKLKLYSIKICSTQDLNKGMANYSTRELAQGYIDGTTPAPIQTEENY